MALRATAAKAERVGLARVQTLARDELSQEGLSLQWDREALPRDLEHRWVL